VRAGPADSHSREGHLSWVVPVVRSSIDDVTDDGVLAGSTLFGGLLNWSGAWLSTSAPQDWSRGPLSCARIRRCWQLTCADTHCPSIEIATVQPLSQALGYPEKSSPFNNFVRSVTRIGTLRDHIGVDHPDAELYRKHAEELTRFATGLVGPTHAGDVVSEAVLRCLGSPKWPKVNEKRAYLYRIVYNEAARFHRSARRRKAQREGDSRMDRPDFLPAPGIFVDCVLAIEGLEV
jgi:hypothetical protein